MSKIDEMRPPKALSKGARRFWRRIVPALVDRGCVDLAAPLQRAELALVCELRSQVKRAERMIAATGGMWIVGAEGIPVENPWLTLKLDAISQSITLGRRLGMTPVGPLRAACERAAGGGGEAQDDAEPVGA